MKRFEKHLRIARTSFYVVIGSLFLTACLNDDDSEEEAIQGDYVPGVFQAASLFANKCETPRTGLLPDGSGTVPDQQGSYVDENNWLRSMSNDLYLWYDEIPESNPNLFDPEDYFDLLVTPGRTPSGTPKDQFHFSADSQEWFDLSQGGISVGYGAEIIIISGAPPRDLRVAYVQPGSPAATNNIERGDSIVTVDGVDVANGSDVDALNNGLFRLEAGVSHDLVVQPRGTTDVADQRSVTITPTQVSLSPVLHSEIIPHDGDQVGYLVFNDHIVTAQDALRTAIADFATNGIDDLVLDIRYNGGGYLAIASQLSYMIAGAAATNNQTFELIRFNDKHPNRNPVTGQTLSPTPFYNRTLNFTGAGGFVSESLPTLNLSRVYVLTGSNTCSASEAIMNGLRGIGVEVIQIGSTTCGKPYGFYEMPNCGTSYFTIQFKGENAQGFGDYADGFKPENLSSPGEPVTGCAVADDFDHDFGDVSEARLAAALQYRIDGSCPDFPISSAANSLTGSNPFADGQMVKPLPLTGKIMQ